MRITVLNPEEELKSFPLTQNIKLKIEGDVEKKTLKDTVFLIRNVNKTGLFNISNRYNQSLGYIREKFDTEDITINTTSVDTGTELTIVPSKPLSPGFEYTLIVTRLLSKPFIQTSKENSKSSSDVSIRTKVTEGFNFKIEVLTTSKITDTSNITKVQITDLNSDTSSVVILNLKKDRTYTYNGLYTLEFISDIYVQNETFYLKSSGVSTDLDDFFVQIKTAITESIKPIINENKSLSLEEILNKEENSQPPVINVTPSYTITYTGMNSFLIHLTGTSTKDLDLDAIKYSTSEAFNTYTLSSMGLYDQEATYILDVQVVDEITLRVKVVQNEIKL